MNLPTANLLLVFAVAALAVSPSVTVRGEDSLDFVDDDGAQPEASIVASGVTQASIITATPTNKWQPSSTTTDSPNTSLLNTASSTSVTATVISTTVPTTTVPNTTDPATTDPNTTDPTTKTTSIPTTTDSPNTSLLNTGSSTSVTATVISTTVPTTTVPNTTDPTTKVPTTTVPTITVPTTTVPTTTVPTTTVLTTTVPTTTVPTTTVSTTTDPTTTVLTTTEDDISLDQFTENGIALTAFKFLANDIETQTSNINSEIEQQVVPLVLINDMEKLLSKVTGSLDLAEADLLQSLVNSIYNVDYLGSRTFNTLSYLLRIQETRRERFNNFSNKLNGMQNQILSTSKGLDDKLKLVNQILKQYIVPGVTNLKESFVNINISQVNSEAELKNLPVVKNLTETSIIKLTSLDNQLARLNHTQDESLYFLGEALNGLEFANLGTINKLLHTVEISQKNIELGISICENKPSEYISKSGDTEKYSYEYVSNGSEDLIDSKNC